MRKPAKQTPQGHTFIRVGAETHKSTAQRRGLFHRAKQVAVMKSRPV